MCMAGQCRQNPASLLKATLVSCKKRAILLACALFPKLTQIDPGDVSMSSHNHVISALLVGDYEQDRLLVHEVFREPGWRLLEARDRKRALDHLARNQVQVVLAETHLPDGDWKSMLHNLR